MTTRSKRRAAELAVIDAAVACCQGNVYGNHALRQATEEYLGLGLERAGEPITGRNSPETSRQAAASLPSLGPLARRVFDEIAYVDGLTCDQVEQTVGKSHQTISARVNELRDKGWIVDSGRRRKTRSNRSAIVWVPSQTARRSTWTSPTNE